MTDSTIYLRCPPTDTDRVAFVYDAIDKWVRSSALSQLVESYGTEIPAGLGTGALIGWLLGFSERWDFRRLQQEAAAKDIGEGARWLLDDSHLAPQQLNVIAESAASLGLVGISEPRERSYDYLLVLGGARLSCLLRPRLASELIARRHIQPRGVIMLASGRPVAASERDATDTYAPEAISEFDLMNTGAETAFQMDAGFSEDRYDDSSNANNSWTIRNYNASNQPCPIVSLSAPSSEPEKRRANSADTYEFFFSKFDVPRGSSLLLVTSQIYVPYQQLEAIRTLALPHDIVVETVGFPPDWGGKLQGMAGPTNYLQETRSTIQSAHRFVSSFS